MLVDVPFVVPFAERMSLKQQCSIFILCSPFFIFYSLLLPTTREHKPGPNGCVVIQWSLDNKVVTWAGGKLMSISSSPGSEAGVAGWQQQQ